MDQNSNTRFINTYVAITTSFVLLYICAITFIPIPKDNVRFVDVSLGFLLGTVLTAGVSYYLGGSDKEKHKPTAGVTSADISATITTTQAEDDKDK